MRIFSTNVLALLTTISIVVGCSTSHSHHFDHDAGSSAPGDASMHSDARVDLGDAFVPVADGGPNALVQITPRPCNGAGWCFEGSAAGSSEFLDVWTSSPDDVWAVGRSVAVHWDGTTWRYAQLGAEEYITDVWGTRWDDVWMTGNDGFLHWNGRELERIELELAASMNAGFSDNEGNVYASGASASVVRREAEVWTVNVVEDTTHSYLAMAGRTGDDVWTVGSSGIAAHWDGGAWTRVESGTFHRLHALTFFRDALWSASDRGSLFRHDGTQFNEVSLPRELSPSGPRLHGVQTITGLGVTHRDTLMTSLVWGGSIAGIEPVVPASCGVVEWNDGDAHVHDMSELACITRLASNAEETWAVAPSAVMRLRDGDEWEMPLGSPLAHWNATWGDARDNRWVVGEQGRISHFDGASWRNVDSGVTSTLTSVHGIESEVWIAGEHGTILRVGADEIVTSYALSTDAPLFAVHASSHDDIWAMGLWGAAFHFDGTEWARVTIPTSLTIKALHGTSSSDLWAVGDYGDVGTPGVVMHYDGSTWSRIANPVPGRLDAVWATSHDDVWAVGDDQGISRITHWDGTAWTDADPTHAVAFSPHDVWARSANDVWVVANDGRIGHFDGVSWTMNVSGLGADVRSVYGLGIEELWVVGANNLIASPMRDDIVREQE